MMALEGIKIIDMALHYPGPFCSMMLADLGADVLKVERPGTGDPARGWPALFNCANRNKRSLTLDLKRPEAKEIFYKLVEEYDVVIEGFRPGVVKNLGIEFETLEKINPRVIYCSISGYGQDGPYRDLPGHDINYLAMSGMSKCFVDEDGTPICPKLMIADQISGMFAALSILAALLARGKMGHGQYIDCSMLDNILFCMTPHLYQFFVRSEMFTAHDAGYGLFLAKDGKYLSLGIAYEDWFWDRLCDVLGLDNLIGLKAEERIRSQKELAQKIQTILRTMERDEVVEILAKADVPVSPVNTLEEVVKNPQVVARGMIQEIPLTKGGRERQVAFPVKLSATPAQMRIPPPSLGEHTEEVLTELGYDKGRIGTLKKEGVV